MSLSTSAPTCTVFAAMSASQEEVGFLASLHRTEISNLERGLCVPRIDTLVKLASVLAVEETELLQGIVWIAGDYRPGSFEVGDPDAQRKKRS